MAVDERTLDETSDAGPNTLLWKPAETAVALGISSRKLWAMTNAGQIPCVRLGRSVRYDPAELRQWIGEHRS